MKDWVIEKIARINQVFYQEFGNSFSSTRHRIQPGVARLLNQTTGNLAWLDVGCGNGTLAFACLEMERKGCYLGCDFSRELLEEAHKMLAQYTIPPEFQPEFHQVDLNSVSWAEELPQKHWSQISLFAVLHHIPFSENRKRLCTNLRGLLQPDGQVFVSVWQLQNSARLLPRIKPWEMVDIPHQEVEEGDVLMDWRAGRQESEAGEALRYVHIFSEAELSDLARQAGFQVKDSFYSDGHEGNLGLYQIWI
jgi:2-polyprenyl-3-methyl-5-hydroxy-6-metoxy-1,4-benzoquinol methylase